MILQNDDGDQDKLPHIDANPSSRGVAFWLFLALLGAIDAGLGFFALIITAKPLQLLFAVMFAALLLLIVVLLAVKLASIFKGGQ